MTPPVISRKFARREHRQHGDRHDARVTPRRFAEHDGQVDAHLTWTLDQLGNWSSFDDQGTTQTRETNDANEITSISASRSDVWMAQQDRTLVRLHHVHR